MSLFNYVKNQLSILDLAREYTTLVKAGQYWRGRCPLHNERTASFTISPHKEIFYCFGCNAGGDIITLVCKKENCSPLEAASLLIERYNLTPPESTFTAANKKEIDAKKKYFVINELVSQWCVSNLKNNKNIQQYLTSRGISQQSLESFGVGYFSRGIEGINACLTFMRRHNILADDLLQATLLMKGKNILYSPFEDRIMFPIRDHLGRLCGFGGRIVQPQDTRAKYYNSRENDYFIKSSLLFGFDQAKHAIQKTGVAFLVEGYTDCIAMVQHGYTNTVATLGTACTQEHLTTLARHTHKLYVVYDGDRAGQEAIMRMTKLCWLVDMELYALQLPAGEDPASLLARGQSLVPFIEQAQDIFMFFITRIGADFSQKSLAHKLALTRELLTLINSLEDTLKQNILLDKAAAILELPLSSLQQELARIAKSCQETGSTQSRSLESEKAAEVPVVQNLPALEKKIFCSIMHNMQLFTSLGESTKDYLTHYLTEPLATLMGKARLYFEQEKPDFFMFFDSLEDPHKLLVGYLIAQDEGVTGVQELEHLVMQLQKRNWKVMVNAMKERVAHATARGDNSQAEKIIKEFLTLKQQYYKKISD